MEINICSNTKKQLQEAGITATQRCCCEYTDPTGSILKCTRPFSDHRDEAPSASTTDSPMHNFRRLLSKFQSKPDQHVMDTIAKYAEFTMRIAAIETEEQALLLYQDAMRVPKSSTMQSFRDEEFIFDGPLLGAVSSKATFLKAFERGVPVVVKIYDSMVDARAELERIEELDIPPSSPFTVGLVPARQWIPQATSPVLTKGRPMSLILKAKDAPSSVRNVYITMPHFPATARDFPLPIPPSTLLQYGKDVYSGLEHCWRMGYGFCDCKPDNIFISNEGRAFLGDYGGLTRLGSPYNETTSSYLPSDFVEDKASETMDRWMLIVSLLELSKTARFIRSLKISDIYRRVDRETNAELKAFFRTVLDPINQA